MTTTQNTAAPEFGTTFPFDQVDLAVTYCELAQRQLDAAFTAFDREEYRATKWALRLGRAYRDTAHALAFAGTHSLAESD